MIVNMQPTGRYEEIRGVQFRVWKGITDGGIEVEFLGLFRIGDEQKKLEFAAKVEEHARTSGLDRLLGGLDSSPGLIRP